MRHSVDITTISSWISSSTLPKKSAFPNHDHILFTPCPWTDTNPWVARVATAFLSWINKIHRSVWLVPQNRINKGRRFDSQVLFWACYTTIIIQTGWFCWNYRKRGSSSRPVLAMKGKMVHLHQLGGTSPAELCFFSKANHKKLRLNALTCTVGWPEK